MELDETENRDFDAATDGEKPLTVWVDTCMQPSGVTLTSLNVSVISVYCQLQIDVSLLGWH